MNLIEHGRCLIRFFWQSAWLRGCCGAVFLALLGIGVGNTALSAERPLMPFSRYARYFHFTDKDVTADELELRATNLDLSTLPYQAVRINFQLINKSSRTIGPLPHLGLTLRGVGATGPIKTTDKIVELTPAHPHSGELRNITSHWRPTFINAGEMVIANMAYQIAKPLSGGEIALFPSPGAYRLHFEYVVGEVKLTTSVDVRVKMPPGRDAKVLEAIQADEKLAQAILVSGFNGPIPDKALRDKLADLLESHKTSSYAGYLRMEIARHLPGLIPRPSPERVASAIAGLESLDSATFPLAPEAIILAKNLAEPRRPRKDGSTADFSKESDEFHHSMAYQSYWAEHLSNQQWRDLMEEAVRTSVRREDRVVHAEHTFDGMYRPVVSVTISPDASQLACATWGSRVHGWDLSSKKRITIPLFYCKKAKYVRLPSGDVLATLSSTISPPPPSVWDGKVELPAVPAANETYHDFAFSPNGDWLLLAGKRRSKVGQVQIWDMKQQKLETTIAKDSDVVRVVFSPDGKHFALVAEAIEIWKVQPAKKIASLRSQDYGAGSIAFASDGQTLVAADGNSFLVLWDIESQRITKKAKLHRGGITQVSYSPNGKIIATAGADSCARLWDAQTLEPLALLPDHTREVLTICFHPDGSQLFTGSIDGTVKAWKIQANPKSPK